jgi:hypothetical protein
MAKFYVFMVVKTKPSTLMQPIVCSLHCRNNNQTLAVVNCRNKLCPVDASLSFVYSNGRSGASNPL